MPERREPSQNRHFSRLVLLRRRARGESGQAIVEFALVAMVFFMLIFGIIDFSRFFHSWVTVQHAAREGARFGAVYAGSDPTGDIKNKVIDASDGILDASNVAVGYVDVDGDGMAIGDSVVVDVHYNYSFITPLGHFLSGAIDSLCLSASSDMRLEQVPDTTPALAPTECN